MASLPEHLLPAPVERQQLSREVLELHQRDRVLTAAAETIAKRGYNATTVDHIVAAAKISIGGFYELFDNKEDCFLQAYERIVADGREQVMATVLPDRPWPEQACTGLRALLRAVVSRPLDARIALVEIQTAGPEAHAHHEKTLAGTLPFLREGRGWSPVADELPATLEKATAGGVLWFLQQRLMMGETREIESHLQELARIVVEPYIGEAEADRYIAAALSA